MVIVSDFVRGCQFYELLSEGRGRKEVNKKGLHRNLSLIFTCVVFIALPEV